MGPSGNFTFNNIYNDPWPRFSHQHDMGIENGGLGVATVFDNSTTRISNQGQSTGGVAGLGSKCTLHDCDSRGMAFTGACSTAMGSAQSLANGNYFFENPQVFLSLNSSAGFSLEIGHASSTAGRRRDDPNGYLRPDSLSRVANAEPVGSADDLTIPRIVKKALSPHLLCGPPTATARWT
jgi:hypothetical protein